MKRFTQPLIIISISLLIALFSAGITYMDKIAGSGYTTSAALFLQSSPTPAVEEDRSVVGSTDGIVIMGGVITLIVLIPILTKRKSWMPSD